MKTLPEQLTCAKREVALRRNTYPKWVAERRMKQESADHELDCMESIVATLEKMVMLAEVSEEMKAMYRKDHPEVAILTHCILCGADILSGTKCVNCEEPVGDLI